MSIEKALSNFRRLNKYSQEEAAIFFGVSQVTFHNWESGKYRPNRKNLERIAEISQCYTNLNPIEFQTDELTKLKRRLDIIEEELNLQKEAFKMLRVELTDNNSY